MMIIAQKNRRRIGWWIKTDMLLTSVVLFFRQPVIPRKVQPFAFGGSAAMLSDLRGFRPEALRPTLSGGLPLSSSFLELSLTD
jgi:hypothetical protein